MKTLTKIGLALTTLWVGTIIAIILLKWESAFSMELNAWGDFLAGLSAPLALLWLVIGYFQQGEELRLNTMALDAQQKELQKQVEETALLAKNSERQAVASEMLAMLNKEEVKKEELKKRADAQPIFWASGGSNNLRQVTTNILNRGGEVYDLLINYTGPYQLSFTHSKLWESGTQGAIIINPKTGTTLDIEWPIKFSVTYRDSLNEKHTRYFQFTKLHELKEIHN
jgi:hypothetical protein